MARLIPFGRRQRDILTLALQCLAFASALRGNVLWRFDKDFHGGEVWLWLGFFLWLLAEIAGDWQGIRAWWRGHDQLGRRRWLARLLPCGIALRGVLLLADSMSADLDRVAGLAASGLLWIALAGAVWIVTGAVFRGLRQRQGADGLPPWLRPNWSVTSAQPVQANASILRRATLAKLMIRACLLLMASYASMRVWEGTAGNRFEPLAMALWPLSAALWALALAPDSWLDAGRARDCLARLRKPRSGRRKRPVIAFAAIMLAAASFRLTELHELPREMMFNHIELLVTTDAIRKGIAWEIYPENLGGRDGLYHYIFAGFVDLPGQAFDHLSLKRLAAIFSLFTLPVMYLFGAEMTRGQGRRARVLAGLLLAGFVAVSYWHVIISREALRLVTTPLLSAWMFVYLARGMRRNRRGDFIKAALLLGLSLYFYKAMRILPAAVLCGAMFALVFRHRSWRGLRRLCVNLAAMALAAFMVLLPLYHVSLELPALFWGAESVTMVGSESIEEAQLERLREMLPALMGNIRAALLMFNWRGETLWTHSVPYEPAMDIYSGALLILGVAAWLARAAKTRDPVWLFLPLAIFIGLLPSALAVARPWENPHNTRTLIALAPLYLLVALPLVRFALHLGRIFPSRLAHTLALAVCVALPLLSNHQNSRVYFDDYRHVHYEHNPPMSDAANHLRGFVASDGAFGNAFIITHPYWWDSRNIAAEAGQWNWWQNRGAPIEELPRLIREASQRTDEFALDPERDLLFFHSVDAPDTAAQLQALFPHGRSQIVQSYMPPDYGHSRYYTFRAPALGREGLDAFLARHG